MKLLSCHAPRIMVAPSSSILVGDPKNENAAAGLHIEQAVFLYLFHNFRNLFFYHHAFFCILRTNVSARTASIAFCPLFGVIEVDSIMDVTNGGTKPTANTKFFIKRRFWLLVKALRIGTPFTPQGTACHKNGGSNALPVIDGKRL